MFQSQLCSGRTFKIAIAIFAVLFITMNTVAADSNQSGNRVWDQSKNMSNKSYTWNSFSFAQGIRKKVPLEAAFCSRCCLMTLTGALFHREVLLH